MLFATLVSLVAFEVSLALPIRILDADLTWQRSVKSGKAVGALVQVDTSNDATHRYLGMTLAALTEEARSKFSIGSDISGVLIIAVQEDSMAAKKGIQSGDVVIEAGEKVVSTPSEVAAMVQECVDRGRASFLLLISNSANQGLQRFVALKLSK